MTEPGIPTGWHIDKGIDLSLILTVLGAASATIMATVKGWLYLHERQRDQEATNQLMLQEIRANKEAHDREIKSMREVHEKDFTLMQETNQRNFAAWAENFRVFADRIEKAIDRMSDKLDMKADKQ